MRAVVPRTEPTRIIFERMDIDEDCFAAAASKDDESLEATMPKMMMMVMVIS